MNEERKGGLYGAGEDEGSGMVVMKGMGSEAAVRRQLGGGGGGEDEGYGMAVMNGMGSVAAAGRQQGGGGGDTCGEEKQVQSVKRSEEEKVLRRNKSSDDRRRAVEGDCVYMSPLDSNVVVFFGGLVLVLLGAIFTRFYKISLPKHIAWDETHFGKHASWYIQGKFFFDVHPPLGKLIIAVAGVLVGYDGSFEFKEPGQEYGDMPYVGMRCMCALMGMLVCPLCYLTVWELTHSNMAALLAGIMSICEIGTLVLSQYILLDPPLLFFVMVTTFSSAKFVNCRREAFELEWWYWLGLSGMFLGCAFSVKWVGAFVVSLVGLTTIKDLWDLLGDLTISMGLMLKHFLARALCLIVWPISIYIAIFAFHFFILSHSGNGDGYFSSEFQSTLVGNELHDHRIPEFVAYGSVITLKNRRGGGGLLHSHAHLYPEDQGKYQQQQVTAYTHKDSNNKWLLKLPNASLSDNMTEEGEPTPQLLRNGDLVILEHTVTGRNLHCHSQKAPITKTHFQVTGYGEKGVGDSNDIWKVEVVGGYHGDPVRTVTSHLRLRHGNIGCYLHSHSKQLPKWGWEQLEVTCNPRQRPRNNIWNVEGNEHEQLSMISFDFCKPSFFSKLLESHFVMAESNNNMKPKEGEITSQAWQWPLNYKGQLFSGGDYRVYLLGNPVIFWMSCFFITIFLSILLIKRVADQRGAYFEDIDGYVNQFLSGAGWLFVGWGLHYFPFFLMGRVLYFHHYFPALLFSIMLASVVVEFSIRILTLLIPCSLKSVFYHSTLVLFMAVIIGSFSLFQPLAYGMSGPKADATNSSMHGLKWLDTWDI